MELGAIQQLLASSHGFDAMRCVAKTQKLTLSSDDSRSLAISSSDGRPPAVTSDASVKVQYDSLLLVGGAMVLVFFVSLLSALNESLSLAPASHTSQSAASRMIERCTSRRLPTCDCKYYRTGFT